MHKLILGCKRENVLSSLVYLSNTISGCRFVVMAQHIDTANEPHKLFDTLLVLDFGSQYVLYQFDPQFNKMLTLHSRT